MEGGVAGIDRPKKAVIEGVPPSGTIQAVVNLPEMAEGQRSDIFRVGLHKVSVAKVSESPPPPGSPPTGTVQAVIDLPRFGEGESRVIQIGSHRVLVTKHGSQVTVQEEP